MIGIGPLEIMVILVVALLVIGPEKMPELARALARLMRDLRGAMDEVRGQFEELTREELFDTKEVDSYYRDTVDSIKEAVEAPDDVKQIGKEIDDTIKQIDKPAEEPKSSEEPKPDEEPKPERPKTSEPPS